MKKISGKKVNAGWYNPRKGEAGFTGEFENAGFQMFTPPSGGIDNDWVLVLDDAAKLEKKPGVHAGMGGPDRILIAQDAERSYEL